MTVYSQFKKVDALPNEEERIKGLHQISSKHIKEILSYTFDENITWLIPDSDPPYTPSVERRDELVNRLLQDMKRIPIFLSIGAYPTMQQYKRESIFLEMIQTIDPDDALLLLGMKARRLPFENLTRELVEKAFPLLAEKWKKK